MDRRAIGRAAPEDIYVPGWDGASSFIHHRLLFRIDETVWFCLILVVITLFHGREADGGRAGRTLCPVRTWCPVIEGFVTRDCSTAEAPFDIYDDMIEDLYVPYRLSGNVNLGARDFRGTRVLACVHDCMSCHVLID